MIGRPISRRAALRFAAGAAMGWSFRVGEQTDSLADRDPDRAPFFRTRGIVLTPDDLTLSDWPERASPAGLSTIALHPTPSAVMSFVKTERGQAFLARCRTLGLQVEY